MRVIWDWSHSDTICGVVIVGILVAIVWSVWPQFTDTGPHSYVTAVESMLPIIRSQIELYNVQNPETRYDATTPIGPAFWDPLVRGNYLQTAPRNPFQNSSTLVGATPAMGTGWVWAPWVHHVSAADDGLPFYVIYVVDESGKLYDGDQDGLPD